MSNTVNPLVSILMPAYNSEEFISQAIDSVLNQTYATWELIIADDGSKDETRKIINSYSDERIKCFHNNENKGYLKTWNRLISKANGEFITFLDSDDTCPNTRLELLLKAFDDNPTIGVVGSNFSYTDLNNKVTATSDFALSHEVVYNNLPNKYNFIGSALMIKREVYEKVGGYNEFFNRIGAEDHYWMFLIMEQFEFINVPQVLYFYRFNPHSVMGDLSENSEKLVVDKLLRHLFNERKEKGSDSLENARIDELKKWLKKELSKVGEYKHQQLNFIAKRRYYEGHKELALKALRKAILLAPYKINYIKDYFYFKRSK